MSARLEQVLARLVERVDGRYFGKYRGFVTANDDPDDLGRIRAKVPRLLGDVETGWALPAFPYGGAADQGLFAIPDVGAGVWVEFEGGEPSYPIWTGTWFTTGAVPEGAKPGQKVLKTKTGHKLVLDDDGGTVTLADANGNTVTLSDRSIEVTAGSATKVVVDAPQIELVGGAAHPLVFGDSLLQYLTQLVTLFQSHTHPGEMALGVFPVTPAPPVPVIPPPTPDLLSVKVKTG